MNRGKKTLTDPDLVVFLVDIGSYDDDVTR
jgi:hypothetical protein